MLLLGGRGIGCLFGYGYCVFDGVVGILVTVCETEVWFGCWVRFCDVGLVNVGVDVWGVVLVGLG